MSPACNLGINTLLLQCSEGNIWKKWYAHMCVYHLAQEYVQMYLEWMSARAAATLVDTIWQLAENSTSFVNLK